MSPANPARDRWLLREPSEDAATLLFCLPYLGSGASMFHRWPRRIGPVEVCPVQPPGRENRLREPELPDYRELAAALAARLARYRDRSIAFFAHCSSVFVAYQTALTLTGSYGIVPARLFVSSMVPPARTPYGSILQTGPGGMAAVVDEMLDARGVQAPPALREMAIMVMSRDLEAYARYRPDPGDRLACPVTVLAWAQDANVPPADTLGWPEEHGSRRAVLEGGHWAFLACPPALQDQFRRDLVPAARDEVHVGVASEADHA